MITKERAYELRPLIEQAAALLSDDVALGAVELFPRWDGDGHEYVKDSRVSYNGLLYKCLSDPSHVSQSTWNPADSPSLWVRVDNPAEEWPEWRQPTGATDGYEYGKKVSHNGKHWISNYNGVNIWEPGVYGWDEVS